MNEKRTEKRMAYLLMVGSYEDERPIRAYAREEAAHEGARDYNNEVPWRHEDDKARVEPTDFVD